MSSKEIDRKIAVIFATDVVGYSKLMENGNRERAKELFLRGENGWKAIYWKNWNKEFHDMIVPILKLLGSLD